MTGKFFNLLAVSSLAILACSFGPTQVSALSGESHNFARHASPAHDHFVKKRKRAVGKRCKVRPPTDPSSTTAATAGTSPANNNAVSAGGSTDTSGGNTGGGTDTSGGSNNNSGAGSTSTSQTPAAQSPAVQANNSPIGGSKGCLAWPNGDDPSLSNFLSPKVNMMYSWSPTGPDNRMGLNYVPMLWGDNQIAEFTNKVVPGYANHVMGFNEPNQVGQSDMNPDYACQLWQQHIAPLKGQGYRLVSPAVTSAPDGKVWMNSFFGAGCDADVVALHWYDISADAFIAYVTDFHNAWGKNIWVTEFACQNFNGGAQCSKDEVFSFFSTVTQWMESQPWIEFYCPFGAMHQMQGVNDLNQLMAGDGGLTDLGNLFVHG